MRLSPSRVLWVIGAALQLCAIPAGAGTLEVAPTTIVLQEDGKSGVLYVNNYGNAAVTVQVEPFDWQQADGRDLLSPSEALMVSPPIVSIPAQTRQTVRLLVPADGSGRERAFRLMVSELPDAVHRARDSIQVLTQFSIPVFAAGGAGDAPQLTWAARLDHGEVQLTAENGGSRHAKLEDLHITAAAGEPLRPANGSLAYVLAGARRSWTLPCTKCTAGEALRIAAKDEISGQKVDQSLTLEP